jgi:nucleoside-diphosphate-sugar epimerase
MEMYDSRRFEIVILRPSMFYGPPVPPGHVEIYRPILDGRMPLVGDGKFARSITYIDNLVQACRLALYRPNAAGQTYYIVDARVYSTKEIVEEMGHALGAPVRYLRLPRSVGPTAYALDRALAALGPYWPSLHLLGESHWHVGISCAKAMRELGFKPEIDLTTGMQRVVHWCRKKGKLFLIQASQHTLYNSPSRYRDSSAIRARVSVEDAAAKALVREPRFAHRTAITKPQPFALH